MIQIQNDTDIPVFSILGTTDKKDFGSTLNDFRFIHRLVIDGDREGLVFVKVTMIPILDYASPLTSMLFGSSVHVANGVVVGPLLDRVGKVDKVGR